MANAPRYRPLRYRLFPIVAFGLLAPLAWWLFGEPQPVRPRSKQPRAIYYLADFDLRVTRPDGHADYDVRGKHMVHYQQADESLIKQPVWTVYTPAGAPWFGRSDTGRITAGGSEVQLHGSVRLHRPASSANVAITLETQHLHLRPHEDYADTDTPVTIYGHAFRIDGIGARAWLRKQRIQLLTAAKGYYAASSH